MRRAVVPALVLTSGLLTSCGTARDAEAGHPVASRSSAGELAVRLAREAPDQPTQISADAHGVVVFGRRGAAIAYDDDGREEWRIDPGEEAGSRIDPIALSAELVVTPVLDRTHGSGLLALERSTGRTRWQAPIADPEAVAVGSVADGSDVVVVVEGSGMVTILGASDGARLVQVALGFGDLLDTPHAWIRGGRVIVGWAADNMSEVRVLEAATGAPVWSWTGPGLGTVPAVGADGVFLVENVEVDGDVVHAAVRRLDLATGAAVWSTPVDGPFVPLTPVALEEDRVVVVDVDGTLRAYDARTGTEQWHRATRLVQLEAQPLLTRRVAAMTTYGTGLVALSARTGVPIRNDVPGPVQTVVTIEGSATAPDGSILLMVRRPAGEGEVWWLRVE